MNKINNKFFQIIKKVQLRVILNGFIIIIFAYSAGGCSVINYFKEPKGFHCYQSDSRIFYETGAEVKAKIIADHLNSLIEEIENKQYRPFTTKIRIYVFSELDNYQKHSLANGSAGDTFGNRYIILSPKKANTPERLPRILAHELSHLHLFGYTGVIKAINLPTWFKEGLAVWASEGAGAENVTEEEARQAILKGLKINPVYFSIFGGEKSHPKNMSTHMFYRQSGMFVKYLYQSNKENFMKLLYLVQEKGDLKYAINSAYNKSIELLWSDFLKSIK